MADNNLDDKNLVDDTLGEEAETPEDAAQREASERGRQLIKNARKLAWDGTKKVVKKVAKPIIKFFQKIMSKIAEFLAPALGVILTILIIIIVAIGLIGFILNVPGFLRAKINQIINDVVGYVSEWWYGDNRNLDGGSITKEDRLELLNYISRDLGFDVIGFGFVPTATYAKTDSNTGEDLTGKQVIVDYDTHIGFISKEQLKNETTSNPDADLMYYYLMANERAYIQRDNGFAGWLFGTKQDWNGMLDIDDETFSDSKIEVDRESKRLKITNPNAHLSEWLNQDKFSYSLEGWTGRYGMPVEFSLALHIASMSSGLVKEMITNENLQTNVKIKLEKFDCDLNFMITLSDGTKLDIPYKPEGSDSIYTVKDNIERYNDEVRKFRLSNFSSMADAVAASKRIGELFEYTKDHLSIVGLSYAANAVYKKYVIDEELYFGGVMNGCSRVIDEMDSVLGNKYFAVRTEDKKPSTDPTRDKGDGYTDYTGITATYNGLIYQRGISLFECGYAGIEDLGYDLDTGPYVCAVDEYGNIDEKTGKFGCDYVVTRNDSQIPENTYRVESNYYNIKESEITEFSCNQSDKNYQLYEQSFIYYNNNQQTQFDRAYTVQMVPTEFEKKYTIKYHLDTRSGGYQERSFMTIRGLGNLYGNGQNQMQTAVFIARLASDPDLRRAYEVTFREIDWFFTVFFQDDYYHYYDNYTWNFELKNLDYRDKNKYQYYVEIYNAMIAEYTAGNLDGAIAKFNELYEKLYADYQNIITIANGYTEPFKAQVDKFLAQIGDGKVTIETLNDIVRTFTGGKDLSNSDVEYSSPYIETVTKHWFKDILFEYEKTSDPIIISYTGQEFDGLQVDAKLTPQNHYKYNKQSGSPYIVKGDVITKDGVLIDDDGEIASVHARFNVSLLGEVLASTGAKAPYTAGDGYRTTKKIFTKGFYYKFDGSAETARSVFWQQQLEQYDKPVLVTVADGRIIRARDVNAADAVSYNPNQEGAQYVGQNGGGLDENGNVTSIKKHYVYVPSDNLRYISPTQSGATYDDVKDSVDRINAVWKYMGISSKREKLSFDNVTTAGEIVAATGLSILKNCDTLDADYIYRDLKEMLIDLGYYTQAEFDQLDVQLKWFIPRYNPSVWPQNSVNDLTFACVLYPLDENAEEENVDEAHLTAEERAELAKKRDEAQLNNLNENVKGFKPNLKVIAPAACEILEVTENSIEFKFDGVEQPDIGIMNGYVMTIRGITPNSSLREGDKINAAQVEDEFEIGRTGTDKIEVFLKNDIGRVLSNVDDYMAPRKAGNQPYEFTDDEIVLLAYVIQKESNPGGLVAQMEYDIQRGYCISYTDAKEAAMAYGEAVGYVLINRALTNADNKGDTIEKQTLSSAYTGGRPASKQYSIANALAAESRGGITADAMKAALVCATYDCDIILKPDNPAVKMTRDVLGESAWRFGHEVFWWLDMDRTEGIAGRGKGVMDEYATQHGTGTAEHPYPVEAGMGSDDGHTGNKSWPWDGYLTYSH